MARLKVFLQYTAIILLSLVLGGLFVFFLLPFADDGDEGNATVIYS